MSEVKVNKISPRSGTTITLGDSGDTFTVPSGVTFDASSGGLAGTLTTAAQPNITQTGTLTSFTSTGIDDNATSTAITIDSSESSVFQCSAGVNSFALRAYHPTSTGTRTIADFQSDVGGTQQTQVVIQTNGHVGIGESSPERPLHVNGGTRDDVIKIVSTDGNSYIGAFDNTGSVYFGNVGSSGTFGVYTGGDTAGAGSSEKFRIDSSGNVGIGTSSPSSKLHVNGNFTSTGIDDNATSTSLTIASDGKTTLDATNETPLFVHHSDGSTVKLGFGNNASNSLDIGFSSSDFIVNINGLERMRLNNSGHAKAVAFTNRSTILNTINPSPDDTNTFEIANGYIHLFRDDTATVKQVVFGKNGSEVGNITTTGSTTAYNTSSDYRLKENVVDLTNATERLKQLQPKRFNFISNADTTVDGFIAHEVSSVVPEAVTGTHNGVKTWTKYDELPEGVSVGDNKLDENGNTIPEYQGIDQSKLVPLLVKTIQELEARITQLENA